ncbi:hypothetical protein BH11BAC7_BH11BAC7_31260 [soil metagenome]
MCNCNKGSSSANKRSALSSSSALSFSSGKSKIKKTQYKSTSVAPPVVDDELLFDDVSGQSFAEKCRTFGYVLGLENPVPENVLAAAIENPDYAKRLLMQRGSDHLYDLLNNPPEKRAKISPASLISKAGKAIVLWGLSGFPTVSKQVLEKREDACIACPHLKASTLVLQKITASSKISNTAGHRTGNKSCAICGCVIRNKIRLETETCPMEDAANPGMNLWGEAYANRE